MGILHHPVVDIPSVHQHTEEQHHNREMDSIAKVSFPNRREPTYTRVLWSPLSNPPPVIGIYRPTTIPFNFISVCGAFNGSVAKSNNCAPVPSMPLSMLFNQWVKSRKSLNYINSFSFHCRQLCSGFASLHCHVMSP